MWKTVVALLFGVTLTAAGDASAQDRPAVQAAPAQPVAMYDAALAKWGIQASNA